MAAACWKAVEVQTQVRSVLTKGQRGSMRENRDVLARASATCKGRGQAIDDACVEGWL